MGEGRGAGSAAGHVARDTRTRLARIRPFGETPAWKFTRENIHARWNASNEFFASLSLFECEIDPFSRNYLEKLYKYIYIKRVET